ncbi:hypothetical protein SBF1_5200002 [Candidatus Desulfosporosinus infrequens]|uniref:Uncharacterized protein n=1 Tax=Candidatus Desulfosporosinus infrequens TaxID=2043169 RepID=A0A2U3LIC3_9FIRM|nr:hypothetical protein SBF1_5200002 [Candidatus Desulfosporosinus infrequens]
MRLYDYCKFEIVGSLPRLALFDILGIPALADISEIPDILGILDIPDIFDTPEMLCWLPLPDIPDGMALPVGNRDHNKSG